VCIYIFNDSLFINGLADVVISPVFVGFILHGGMNLARFALIAVTFERMTCIRGVARLPLNVVLARVAW